MAEGREAGLAEGREAGLSEGRMEMQKRINKLGLQLKAAGRLDDLFRSMEDTAYQQQLLEEKKQLQNQLKQADDPVFVQDAAREVLRMVNPGETIYVMDIPAQPADDKEEKTDGN